MSICGYNAKIGEGFRTLVDGMVEALEKKAESATIDEVLNREIIELETMIATMRRAKGETNPEMFIGLNILAKALFEQVRANLKAANSQNMADECRSVGNAFNELLAEAERRSEEKRLRGGQLEPPETFARELAEWVLKESSRESLPR